MTDVLDGFDRTAFTAGGATRTVYRTGTGPAVIVVSELPGITPNVARFATTVADAGFTAVMPHLFGEDGRPPTAGYTMTSLAQVCVAREFTVLATGRTSPIIGWLRALAADQHKDCGGPGVGAIGMCFTGGFALAMMVDEVVVAPVLSQPSAPFPVSRRRRRDLGISPEDAEAVRRRAEAGTCVLGLRFSGDWMSPPARFDHLRELLGDAFVAIELDSAAGNPHGHGARAHSVLTEDLDDRPGTPTRDALDRVLAFLRERLLP